MVLFSSSETKNQRKHFAQCKITFGVFLYHIWILFITIFNQPYLCLLFTPIENIELPLVWNVALNPVGLCPPTKLLCLDTKITSNASWEDSINWDCNVNKLSTIYHWTFLALYSMEFYCWIYSIISHYNAHALNDSMSIGWVFSSRKWCWSCQKCSWQRSKLTEGPLQQQILFNNIFYEMLTWGRWDMVNVPIKWLFSPIPSDMLT